MDYEGLTLEKDAGIVTLTLNRPEQLNALSPVMAQGLEKILAEVSHDDSAKVLIITGAGRGFCAGLDADYLSKLSTMSLEELYRLLRSLTFAFDRLTKPTIAAINGVVAGAGLAITLFCDLRIAAADARFFSGYNRMGITPDVGISYNLPRIVGTTKAMEILLTGDPFDTAEALKMGMLNNVVPSAELMKMAKELASKIASGPSVAVNLTRQALKKSYHNNLEQQIDVEFTTMATSVRTEDHQEGLRAFREKRPPQFKGK